MLRGPVLMAVIALLLAGCSGSTDDAEPAATAQANGTDDRVCLAGIIVNDELLPLENAVVTVRQAQLTTTTDTFGRFMICGLEARTYDVELRKPGHEATDTQLRAPNQADPAEFVMVAFPPLVPHVDVLPFTLFYDYGFAPVDTTTGRVGANETTCGPCDFTIRTGKLPDHILLEATWQRSATLPQTEDLMYHIFRVGSPFSEATDVGAGAKPLPWAFNYPKSEFVRVGATPDAGGGYSFTGSLYCDGGSPCVSQRIDVWASVFYDHPEIPKGYTALPE